MQKLLYFICPTDCLESIINHTFRHENYYYSSLGNSVEFDNEVVGQIKELILIKNIREISFVLSSDNRIVLDALSNQDFSDITGLNNYHNHIIKEKERSEVFWKTLNHQRLILSYHLNGKMKELKLRLNDSFFDQLKISGQIYNKQENTFHAIYPELICVEYLNLN